MLRLKSTIKLREYILKKVFKITGVKNNQIWNKKTFYSSKKDFIKWIKVKFYDSINDKSRLFFVNNFELFAQEIALVSKQRV